MTLDIRPLTRGFCAEVAGYDFSTPPEKVPVDEIRAAMNTYGALVFRGSPPTDEQHVAFSKLFGAIEKGTLIKVAGVEKRRLKHLELVDVGNLDFEGHIYPRGHRRMLFRKGDRLWHVDMSFMDNRATYSMLVGHEVPPEGGDTEFADARAAYDALPAEMKTLVDGLTAEHSVWHSRASHASHIVGWPIDLGRDLIASLLKFATQPRFVYRHQWRQGDLVMWDNLATLHRGTDFDDHIHRRDVRRATCREREIVDSDASYA